MHPHAEPAFSIDEIPFSYAGSWLNLSTVVAEKLRAPDVHLVSHQNGLHPVLALRVSDQLGPVAVQGTPGQLRWHSTGEILAAFETVDTLRVRGSGLNLTIAAASPELTPFSGQYLFEDPRDGSFLLTSYETGQRYRITVLTGHTAETRGLEQLGPGERSIRFTADEAWEIAIEEYASARPPYELSHTYTEVVENATAAFRNFVDRVAPWRSAETPAAELAAYVIWSATVAPAGYFRRPAVLMSKHWMDKVWSWDHCFNALALAPGEPDLALHQFLLPFDHQDHTGALPDSVSHSEILFNYVKPPVHGWALTHLRALLPSPLTRGQLEEIYERLAAWSRYWLNDRRSYGHRLPHYQHGNDSGWDNATTFDQHRLAETPDLAAFLILQLQCCSSLADELGYTSARDWDNASAALTNALFTELWDGTRMQAQSPSTTEQWSTSSLLELMIIVLGHGLPDDILAEVTDSIQDHLTEWGLATEPPNSPHYEPDGYWRGPIWAPTTVLIADGLRRAGNTRLADEIATRFRALCERSGFAENFHAETGQGLRDRAYTWTAAAYLILCQQTATAPAAWHPHQRTQTPTKP